MDADDGLLINKTRVAPGARVTNDLRVARLYTHSEITMPVHVVHGRQPGPRLFVSAAIHGDELNGVEIIRNATDGIDLHTGALHRDNLPQIRADLADKETARLARSFRVPVLLDTPIRAGSLREVAACHDMPMLLYEAGEALRFNEAGIKAGVRGVIDVMRTLGMLPAETAARRRAALPMVARASSWVRAPESGIFRTVRRLGDPARKGDLLGVVADPFGERETAVVAPCNGMIISRMNLPLVNAGDALFHIARFDRAGKTAREEVLQKEDQFDESRPDEADEML